MSTPTRTGRTSANTPHSHKTCQHCGQTKPRDQFAVKTPKHDQRQPYCLECWPVVRDARKAHNRRLERQRAQLRREGSPTDREAPIYLDCTRIIRWIDSLPRPDDFEGEAVLAERFGTTVRQLFRWRNEPGSTTPIDTFDRMVVKAGMPWVLKELFPELWEFDEDGNPHPAIEGWRRRGAKSERREAA